MTTKYILELDKISLMSADEFNRVEYKNNPEEFRERTEISLCYDRLFKQFKGEIPKKIEVTIKPA